MKRTTYYQGGYQPAAPAQNRSEEWDDAAATYTAWTPAGVQTVQRALTPGEVAQAAAAAAATVTDANTATVRARAQAALTANATFLALSAPTTAQTLAQVQRLTRQTNATIRLLLGLLADITDTA
jgi:hypothetical protein